ncbi:hypothetical protein [Catellatospora sp. NPDC049609]|uniref:hypothetical protein n=1 Tax=Catellatospora sp. NPDC049609 TaxID=3155505 RepID=UPI003445D37D
MPLVPPPAATGWYPPYGVAYGEGGAGEYGEPLVGGVLYGSALTGGELYGFPLTGGAAYGSGAIGGCGA